MRHLTKPRVPRLLAAVMALGACTGGVTADADDNYVGAVTSVNQDTIQMHLDSGGSMRVDTFGVCGDATASNISVGDRITVTANREAPSFDATAILDENGEPACGGSSSAGGTTDSTTNGGDEDASPPNAGTGKDGEFLLTLPGMGVCETVDAPQGGTFVIDGVGSAVVTLEGDRIEVGEVTNEEDWRSNMRAWEPARREVSSYLAGHVEIAWQDDRGRGPTDLWLDMRLSDDTLTVVLCGGV